MEVHPYAWAITAVVMVAILTFDVFVIGRRPHEPSTKEASHAIAFFVGLAVLFGLGVWYVAGARYAGEFFAGWITEYSLSVDNLFIFLIIMAKLRVPRELQQFALLIGIILALVFRGIFIAVGAAAIERFAWVFFIFGAFLIYTAVKLFLDYRKHDEDDEVPDNAVMRLFRRKFNATPDFRGTKLTVKEQGKRFITPMFFVIVALGSTDLLFALDSIPAIYGLTEEPYLVFTANVFALMGLRQLYFLIGGLLRKLVYLSLGLSVVLGFIGVKLVLHALHEYHWADWAPWGGEIPIWFSLLVIVGTLAVTTIASLAKSRNEPVDAPKPMEEEDAAERPAGIADSSTPPAAP
ncbi:MAG: Integral membrane protein TerC [uncultured Friedmanniella sp.]|uniref:Integral membrane protein TerC n=1 Tax=uncultured Friedmanniella sp. TaxID=335381 RepID=A0A6J4LGM5_9ACTN|nr:TerC family protein [uncultured Friedmanniella sp.]CAA9330228.1 MAG: Integral membrane protein TerC [uncultured Friedmanniella sp.]